MAYADFPITWAAPDDADASTNYEIWADTVTPGNMQLIATQAATINPGGADYTPITTTLSGALTKTETTITLASYTNIAAGDEVSINDLEMVDLGTGSGPFSASERGWGGSVAIAHADGVPVYHAHESYTYSPPFHEDNNGRKLIRAEVRRRQGLDISIVRELHLPYPTPPRNAILCTVYGTETDEEDNPMEGVTVNYTLTTADTYVPSTGETIIKRVLTKTTDADGYWEFQLHKAIAVEGSVAATIEAIDTVSTGQPKSTYNIVSVPDQNFAHVRECLA